MFRKKKSHARNVRHPLIRRPILKNVDDCLCAMARKPHPFMTPLQGLPLFYGPGARDARDAKPTMPNQPRRRTAASCLKAD